MNDLFMKNYGFMQKSALIDFMRVRYEIDPIIISFNLWCLSHAQLSEYLSYLGERGLIEALPKQIKVSSSVEKHIYKIAEKGCRLLQISQEIEGLVGLD
jgi:predicted transcriptional regulator